MMLEQTSSYSIEFEPLPSSPHFVVLNHDRGTTMIFHDEPLVIGKIWAKESSDALTLESEGKDSIDEHGSFILELLSP